MKSADMPPERTLIVAVVDDNPGDAKGLSDWLDSWGTANGVRVLITAFSDVSSLLDEWERGRPFDALFLDICLPGAMSGMDAAEQIRAMSRSQRIVFVTESTQFFESGFAVDATDYLVKPIDPDRLNKCMERLMRQIPPHGELMVQAADGGTMRVPLDAIEYITSVRNYAELHVSGLPQDTYRVRDTLKNLEAHLPDFFVQCRRTDIVNLFHVRSIKGRTLTLTGGDTLQAGRKYIKPLRDAFFRVFGGTTTV